VTLLAACGGGDLVLPADSEPATLEIVAGDGQTGRVGATLADPVVALVSDGQGRPMSGVPVVFVLEQGSDATVSPDTVPTDGAGRATFQVTMGTKIGVVHGDVRLSAAEGRTLSAPVSLTAVSADANELAAVSGDGQTAPAGTGLPEPLVVRVTDAFGNPIHDVAVTWTTDGGGDVSEATTVTGPDGLASVRRTLGPTAGSQQTLATAQGLAGSPVTFTHTATAGAAAVLELVSGDGQSAAVGTPLADPLVVRAHDAGGNPVAGLAVAWVVGEGGGSLAPATSTTAADGSASTLWTLGAAPGRNSATAVISGVGVVSFSATATAATPPGLTIEVQPPDHAVRGVELDVAPVVQLREPDGSPRRSAGVSVSVALVPGGATLSGTLIRTTGADGRAEFRGLSLEGPPGSYALAFAATGYAGVVSRTIVLARAATTTVILSDDPDPSAPGSAVRVRFRVTSPGGVPDGAVQVASDDGASCSASVSSGECSLTLATAGTRLLTATYTGDAEFEGSAATEQHTVQSAEPIPTTTRITADDPDPSDVGQAVTVRFTVTTASGSPAGSVTVTASGGGESCSASVADGACVVTFTAAGDRTLTATYAGKAGFAGSSDTELHQVKAPAPPPPPSTPSATASSIEVKDASIEVDHDTDVKVVVRDATGRKLEGIEVTLSATGGGNSIEPASVTTDRRGEAKFKFRSTEAGTKMLTAVAGGVELADHPIITVRPAR
jgi:Bacterial Ig-like domain (group 1)/Bacterial Ig-like domain (group 3)